MPNEQVYSTLSEAIKTKAPNLIEAIDWAYARVSPLDLFSAIGGHPPLIQTIFMTNNSVALKEILKRQKVDFSIEMASEVDFFLKSINKDSTDRTPRKSLPKGKHVMNWVQFALQYSNSELCTLVYDYMLKHNGKEKSTAMINQKFYYFLPLESLENKQLSSRWVETTLASAIFWTISNKSLFSNVQIHSKDNNDYKKALLGAWLVGDEHGNSLNERLQISLGSLNNIKFLVENDLLSTSDVDHDNRNLERLAQHFINAARSKEAWCSKTGNRFRMDGVEFTSQIRVTGNDKGSTVAVEASIKPLYGKPPHKFIVKLLQPQMADIVLKELEKKVSLQPITRRLEQVEQKISELPDHIVNQSIKVFEGTPHHEIAKKLYRVLESLFRQKMDAGIGVFEPSSVVSGSDTIKTVNNLLAPLTEATAPGLVALHFVIQSALTELNRMKAEKTSKDLFNLNTDPRILALIITIKLVTELMEVYPKNPPTVFIKPGCCGMLFSRKSTDLVTQLCEDVRRRIDQKGVPQYTDVEQAANLLCSIALNRINPRKFPAKAVADSISTRNSDSSNESSGRNQLVARPAIG